MNKNFLIFASLLFTAIVSGTILVSRINESKKPKTSTPTPTPLSSFTPSPVPEATLSPALEAENPENPPASSSKPSIDFKNIDNDDEKERGQEEFEQEED